MKMAEQMRMVKGKLAAACEARAKMVLPQAQLLPDAESKIEQYRQDAQEYKAALEERGFGHEVSIMQDLCRLRT